MDAHALEPGRERPRARASRTSSATRRSSPRSSTACPAWRARPAERPRDGAAAGRSRSRSRRGCAARRWTSRAATAAGPRRESACATGSSSGEPIAAVVALAAQRPELRTPRRSCLRTPRGRARRRGRKLRLRLDDGEPRAPVEAGAERGERDEVAGLRPFPRASPRGRPSGSVAAVVLPYFWMLLKTFASGQPERFLRRLVDPEVRLVHQEEVDVVERLSVRG